MACRSCKSDKQTELLSEICIHQPRELESNKPHIMASPKLLLCLNCGFTEFAITNEQLNNLTRADSESE